VLTGLAAGASLGGLLVGNAAAAVPALPLAGLAAALSLAAWGSVAASGPA